MHRTFARAVSASALVVVAAVGLTSCSLLTAPAAPTATPIASTVVDPSIPSPEPTASAETTAASPAPTSTDAGTADPTATPTPSSPAGQAAVSPFVTNASWDASSHALVASAIVPRIVERDGVCTLTATRGSVTRSASAAAGPGAQYTGCGALTIPGSKLAAGTWSVTVAYASPKYRGTSAARTVQVEG